jgi:hypothetical protein
VLRSKLADLLKAEKMEQKGEQQDAQASGAAAMLNSGGGIGSQSDGIFSSAHVLGDMFRHIQPLASEEPEEILRFFVKISEIYELG